MVLQMCSLISLHEHVLDDGQRALIGVAAALHELHFKLRLLHGRVDGLAAAVYDHRQHAHRVHEHDVAEHVADGLLIVHHRAAALDDDDLAPKALDVP